MTSIPHDIPSTLQQLPPKAAHLCLEVERFVAQKLNTDLTGTHIVLACSGGLDSTALLFIFYYLTQKLSLTLTVAHFNHQTRNACRDDELFVQHCCKRLGLTCVTGTEDVPFYAKTTGIGLEEAARTLRYHFLADACQKHQASWICTAHQADDLAEDVLMRLIRGAGWPALGGMSAIDDNRKLLRPLLVTKRHKLNEFLNALSIPWRHDESNEDMSFLRNRVRNTILPLFLQENPAFLDNISTLWQLASLDSAHWDAEMDALLTPVYPVDSCTKEKTDGSTTYLSRTTLNPLSTAQRLRVYKTVLDRMGKGQVLAENLIKLDAAWHGNRGGSVVQFPGDKKATIHKGGIIFTR